MLRSEWSALSAAPWSFVFVVAGAFAIAFAVSRWAYKSLLDTANGRLDALKERLAAKDEQIAEYRERLKLIPSNGNKFSLLTQRELQEQALTFVETIRHWYSRLEVNTRAIAEQQWSAMTRAQNEEQRRQLWEAHTSTHTSGFQQTMREFEQQFKVDAILLKDELNVRLPATERNMQMESRYEFPTNTFCIRAIADDLERKAKLLR